MGILLLKSLCEENDTDCPVLPCILEKYAQISSDRVEIIWFRIIPSMEL